jgi:CHAD domain
MPRSARSPSQKSAISGATIGELLATEADSLCRVIAHGLSDARNRHAGIHRARRAMRSLRGLLALLIPVADGDQRIALARFDARLQRVCKSLSGVRDAHVVVLTAASLSGKNAPKRWPVLQARLGDQRELITRRALEADPDFAARRQAIAEIRVALPDLPWGRLDADDVRRGLKHSRRRARSAEQHARHSAVARDRHRYRRRLRRLLLQVEVLEHALDTAPKAVRAVAELPGRHKRKQQASRLGRLQDAQMLRRTARRIKPAHSDTAILAVLNDAVRSARKDLGKIG